MRSDAQNVQYLY